MSLTRELLVNRAKWKLLILVLAVLSGALGLTGPIFQKAFIDSLTANGDVQGSFRDLLMFFGCFLLSVAAQLTASYLGQREANVVQEDLGKRIYRKMLRLKSSQMAGTQVGEVVSLYTVDAPGSGGIIELAWTNGLITLIPILLAPFMLRNLLHLPLAPLLLTMGISLGIMFLLSYRQSGFFYTFKKLAAERTGLVNEWVQNIRALRALGWTDAFERKIFDKRTQETQNRVTMVSNGQMMASIGASIGFFLNLAGVYALVKLRPDTTLSAGELTATFWALGVYLARPLRGIPWIITFTLDAYTSIRRVEKFLSIGDEHIVVAEPKIDMLDGRQAPAPAASSTPLLEVEHLNLTLGGKALLKDISLKVERPQFIAVVGAVGSGKTLFVQSLLGETPARFGRYRLLGRNVADLSEAQLKANFALVPQDGFTASTTIRNNIELEYRREIERQQQQPSGLDAAPDLVLDSLQRARFDLGAEGFADGSETMLGERGVNLSGGQRQRLGLARALHIRRPFLLLDDSLSAIDVNTEREMVDTLFREHLKKNVIFLITHRHLTLPLTDRVLYFRDGTIRADGRFEDLMQNSDEFRRFMSEMKEKNKEKSNELLH